MLNKPIPLVLVSQAGDALFFQGPDHPALFAPAHRARREQFIPINGPLCLSVMAVLFAAKAQFSVIRDLGDDALLKSDVLLSFTLPNGLQVAVVTNDLVVALHHQCFAKQGFHLLVGPNLCQNLG